MSAKQTASSFWARVAIGPSDECWDWTGCTNSTGYGNAAWHGKVFVAHRVAAWLVGLVRTPAAPMDSNDPTHVLHKCDNRRCCNPKHFFLGSFSDNQKDAYSKGRKEQPKGMHHANSKLTDTQAKKIRARYEKGGIRQVDLAAQYGVSQEAISLLVRGRTYICS